MPVSIVPISLNDRFLREVGKAESWSWWQRIYTQISSFFSHTHYVGNFQCFMNCMVFHHHRLRRVRSTCTICVGNPRSQMSRVALMIFHTHWLQSVTKLVDQSVFIHHTIPICAFQCESCKSCKWCRNHKGLDGLEDPCFLLHYFWSDESVAHFWPLVSFPSLCIVSETCLNAKSCICVRLLSLSCNPI